MQFSYLAVFVLLLIILLALLLLAPFSLSLNIGKKGSLVEYSIKLAWLGRTLRKADSTSQSAGDLLACIGEEKARENKNEREEKEDREQERKGERSEIDNQNTGGVKSPDIHSLINAAPALANILRDLLKSIHVNISSCRLCFGLSDPSQTAVICGYLWFLASALGFFPARIFIEPCFEGERLEGELVADIEARVLWAVFAVISALREREIRLLLREMLGWA